MSAFVVVIGPVLSAALGPRVVGLDPAPAGDGSAALETPRSHVRAAQAQSMEGPELFHRYRGEVVAGRDTSLAMWRGRRLLEVAVQEGYLIRYGDALSRMNVAN